MVDAIARGDGSAARQVIASYLEESAVTLVSAMQKMHTQETA